MEDEASLEPYIDAALALAGIPVAPEWMRAIRFHLAVSLRHARRVEEFALPDEAEPAPVYAA